MNNNEHLSKNKEALPTVIWVEPKKRVYSALNRGGRDVSEDELGIYYDKIKKIDLSDPVRVPEYFQLSFRTVSMFRKCPLRFFYNIVLGLKWERIDSGEIIPYQQSCEYEGFKENVDSEIVTGDALSLGGIVHEYLEINPASRSIDNELFEQLLIKYDNKDNEGKGRSSSRSLRNRALRHLSNTVKDERLAELMRGREIFSEIPFLVRINRSCEFKGVIDKLIVDKEKGSCSILDWKTNDLTDKDPVKVAEENDYFLQVACYKWAVEQLLKERVEQQYIYFTDTGYLLKNEAKEKPNEIINEMLQKINEYGGDRELWIKAGNDLDYSFRKCTLCEYQGFLCGVKIPAE